MSLKAGSLRGKKCSLQSRIQLNCYAVNFTFILKEDELFWFMVQNVDQCLYLKVIHTVKCSVLRGNIPCHLFSMWYKSRQPNLNYIWYFIYNGSPEFLLFILGENGKEEKDNRWFRLNLNKSCKLPLAIVSKIETRASKNEMKYMTQVSAGSHKSTAESESVNDTLH